MKQLFELTWNGTLQILASCLGIYIAVILLTRIFGKRSFSKMSSFDFAMTVAVGSLIATTILSASVSLAEGMVGLFSVYLFQLTAAYFRRYSNFRNAIDNRPLLLMDGATIIRENLKKARVTEGDLRAKLREANVTDFTHIQAVVFETTGDISVIHSKSIDEKLKAYLLEDVSD
ncbi:DUF421 domain-containing protein [Vitellibacter sp. q18]|jgi:uncharacterized membrane protein YcaP (DUF421 family)|nr:DUF421 domain-containing protein [Aequorivita lutea]